MTLTFPKQQIVRSEDLLSYDQESGIFTWRRDWYSVRAGAVAGHVNAGGYVVIGLFGQEVYAHRLAWIFATGASPIGVIDHIDGDRTNNALRNLRDVSNAANVQNVRQARSNSASGLLGVHFRKDIGKWQARIQAKGECIHLGVHLTKELAYEAYVAAKRIHHEGCTL